jgi:signal transduction histidine kinase
MLQAEKWASIGTLAAGIAHEINSPMQFVASNTEFIEGGFEGLKSAVEFYRNLVGRLDPAGTPLQECAEVRAMEEDIGLEFMLREVPLAVSQTKQGIKRVTDIVVAMRDFSHSSQTRKLPVVLNDLVRATVILTRNFWKYVSELKLDLSQDLPLVECNSSEINQVILNLVMNAVHATEERRALGRKEAGLIEIRSFQQGEFVVLEVIDNGTGITSDVLPRIFDPFFTTKEVGKGTGQGLAICYDFVVQRHGGDLDVESQPGRTVFKVTLPVKHSTQLVE